MRSNVYLGSLLVITFYVKVCKNIQDGILPENKPCSHQSSTKKCTAERTNDYSFSGRSSISNYPGHWPGSYCKITDVYLKTAEKTFFVGAKHLTSVDLCYGTRNIWNFRPKPNFLPETFNHENHTVSAKLHCDQVFQTGYVFTIYYYHGSNYFHLHYDAILPLYYALHYENKSKVGTPKNTILMPSVEVERGRGTNWDTDAFMNESTYWNSLLKVLAGPYWLLPLDKKLIGMEKSLCFKEIYFGTPKIDHTMSNVIQGYAAFVKSHLNVPPYIKVPFNERKQLGLIHRDARRKILNEQQLLTAIESFMDVELVDFVELSFSKQVENVQKYDILVGMNGAGLMNALYLPNTSVAIQLVPYEAQVNHNEYSDLLKARGPYLHWHNLHSNSNRASIGDKFNNCADTVVDVDEFVALIKNALELQN